MKYFKVLLQLHSIKLTLFFALAIVFLVYTAINSSSKAKPAEADSSIQNEANSSPVVNSVSR